MPSHTCVVGILARAVFAYRVALRIAQDKELPLTMPSKRARSSTPGGASMKKAQIKQLTLAERCQIDRMIRQQKASPNDALHRVNAGRHKNSIRKVGRMIRLCLLNRRPFGGLGCPFGASGLPCRSANDPLLMGGGFWPFPLLGTNWPISFLQYLHGKR